MKDMIKEKKLEGEEKALFRKGYAEPLWEDFKLCGVAHRFYV